MSLSHPLLLPAVLALAAATAQAQPEAAAPAASARAGTFKQVQGQAWVGRAEPRRAAQPGDGLAETDRLSTGTDGSATIVLKDGTALTVGPNSTVDLSRFQFDSTTQQGHLLLDLLRGSVRVVTGLLARINPERFQVQTPTSVVGVRGTDFIVETEAAR
jgi:hypothetical protein